MINVLWNVFVGVWLLAGSVFAVFLCLVMTQMILEARADMRKRGKE